MQVTAKTFQWGRMMYQRISGTRLGMSEELWIFLAPSTARRETNDATYFSDYTTLKVERSNEYRKHNMKLLHSKAPILPKDFSSLRNLSVQALRKTISTKSGICITWISTNFIGEEEVSKCCSFLRYYSLFSASIDCEEHALNLRHLIMVVRSEK